MPNVLHQPGVDFAEARINAGDVDTETDWEFTAEDGNEILGGEPEDANDSDWERFGRHHLARETDAESDTKAGWAFPFAKLQDGQSTVFRSGLIAIRQRAGQTGDDEIFNAAGRFIDMIDNGEERKTAQEFSRKSFDADIVSRQMAVRPQSLNKDNRTFDIIFSTGAEVKRNTFFGFGEDFIERLSMEEENIRLGRLKSGAPFLNTHESFAVSDVLGVIENPRIENGIGIATVKMSRRDDVDPIFQDIEDGILRNVSVGYRVHRFEEIGLTDDGLRILNAVDWEPFEVSLVPIGADPGAQVRKRQEDTRNKCEIIFRENDNLKNPNGGNSMPEVNNQKPKVEKPEAGRAEPQSVDPQKQETTPQVDPEKVRGEVEKEVTEKERKRVSEILKACRKAGLSDEKAQEYIADGYAADKVRELVIDQLAERDQRVPTQNANPDIIVGKDNEREARMTGVRDAILYRANSSRYKLTEEAKQFRYMTLLDCAREFARAAGHNIRSMSKWELTRVALHSTSDFPEVLANTVNKSLRDSFDAAPQTFGFMTRRVSLSDFKEVSRVQLGDAPDLEEVPENGEIKRGSVGEQAEKYSLKTFGKIIAVTRQAIVNDDLDAFGRIPQLQGRAAADLESDLVWEQITSNPVMADGNQLFSAAHNNLVDPGGVPGVAQLATMRANMRKQTGLNGRLLNVPMRWLVVPPELETDADKLVTQITPRNEDDPNPFAGRLQVASEPRLSSQGDADDWYTSATVDDIDMIELGTLEGNDGPVLEQREGFEVEGIELKVRHDVAARVIEFRGLQKNEGGASE